MSFMERLAEGAQQNGMAMAREALELLQEIRDRTGEGKAARETFFNRVVSMDVAGGLGAATWEVPPGVGIQLSSIAVTMPGVNGRVSVYGGSVAPAALMKTVTVPAAAIAGLVAASDTFGPADYLPAQSRLSIVAEGIGTDGRATVVLRGKMFVVGDAMDTSHGGT